MGIEPKHRVGYLLKSLDFLVADSGFVNVSSTLGLNPL